MNNRFGPRSGFWWSFPHQKVCSPKNAIIVSLICILQLHIVFHLGVIFSRKLGSVSYHFVSLFERTRSTSVYQKGNFGPYLHGVLKKTYVVKAIATKDVKPSETALQTAVCSAQIPAG